MLILGSSKGLGKELYRMFNDINYEVIGVSRSESQYTDIVCDLSDKKQVRLLVSKIFFALCADFWASTISGRIAEEISVADF